MSCIGRLLASRLDVNVCHQRFHLMRHLSFAKTPSGGHVVDLSAPIRRQSQLDDHPLAPPASAPPVPLRWPSPARPREPRLAPAVGRVQENGAPTQASPD